MKKIIIVYCLLLIPVFLFSQNTKKKNVEESGLEMYEAALKKYLTSYNRLKEQYRHTRIQAKIQEDSIFLLKNNEAFDSFNPFNRVDTAGMNIKFLNINDKVRSKESFSYEIIVITPASFKKNRIFISITNVHISRKAGEYIVHCGVLDRGSYEVKRHWITGKLYIKTIYEGE